MQPQMTSLPYYPDAVLNYFNLFSSQPWSMLLHSGNSNHCDSRYDILVAAPVVTLVTYNGFTKICKEKNCLVYNEDPFRLVEQELKASGMTALPDTSLPFLGGALGYFGYDLVRSIEIIPNIAQKKISLPDMAIGIYRWAIIADHYYRKITLISHDDPIPILNQLSIVFSVPTPFYLLGSWNPNMTRTEYGEKFRQIQQHLLAGDCYQVCLAQTFSAPCKGNEWLAFRHLLMHNRAPFSAFIRLEEEKAVMSLSPERFLRLQGNKIQTKPIKGTIPRMSDSYDDIRQILKLSTSIKDQAENLMIVDLLRNDIGRVAKPGSVQVPSLFNIETFVKVHHMTSTITAILEENYTPLDLIRACFPGGSITGAPKIRAIEIIENLEPQRRSVWCGSIGYISCCGTMDTNIAIRTFLVANQHVYCPVGSGLVADSNEEAEYQETLIKVASLIPPLKKYLLHK